MKCTCEWESRGRTRLILNITSSMHSFLLKQRILKFSITLLFSAGFVTLISDVIIMQVLSYRTDHR